TLPSVHVSDSLRQQEGSSMRISRLIASTAASVAALIIAQAACADPLIEVDKSAQRMIVAVDGEQVYHWPAATGGNGYDTRSSAFKLFRTDIDHYSEEWDNAP